MTLTSARLLVEDFAAVQEAFHSKGWTDGLPIVPPTAEAVEACLDWAGLVPEHLIGVESVRGRALTAEKVAINAVMAGCLPMHFPVVVTAADRNARRGISAPWGHCQHRRLRRVAHRQRPDPWRTRTRRNLQRARTSDRGTTCIGRAIRLVLGNLLEVRPGDIDRSTFGHPGKISFCIAEDEENSPWKSVAEVRLGDPYVSAVTAMAAMSPRQVMNEWTTDPREILDTYVAEIKANMAHYSIWPGNYAIVVPPQLRQHFDAAGWTKVNIREYVYEQARLLRGEWANCGKGAVVGDKADREYQALPDPDHLIIVAAGGPAGGFGAVIPPWLGHKSRAVTVAVGACVDC